MGYKVFVPCTDEQMEAMAASGTPLVPYHPDRPCWRHQPGGRPLPAAGRRDLPPGTRRPLGAGRSRRRG